MHTGSLALVLSLALSPFAFQQVRTPAPEPARAEDSAERTLVRWHASYDAALAAARVSRKPVLLFQLLGRLDDALC
jgi:hypothetical protein